MRTWPWPGWASSPMATTPALDAAIDACLARTERTLYTRWRAISFLARVRYEGQPTPDQPATSRVGRANGDNGQAPGSSQGPR
jgi:hypothetical protein